MLTGGMGSVAQRVFREHIIDKGRKIPKTAAEMRLIVRLSGASVTESADAPNDFMGVQIGSTLYVNGTSAVTDFRRLQILAHEWFHYLRRQDSDPAMQTYLYSDQPHSRDIEEQHAKEFERLF